MKNTTTSSKTFTDPVCFMKVNTENKDLMLIYKTHTYYFCAESCRKAFKENPEKYLGLKAPKRKGLWGRYLDRLNKATGGEPPKCH